MKIEYVLEWIRKCPCACEGVSVRLGIVDAEIQIPLLKTQGYERLSLEDVRIKFSWTCFAQCQEFCLSGGHLSSSFNFIYLN